MRAILKASRQLIDGPAPWIRNLIAQGIADEIGHEPSTAMEEHERPPMPTPGAAVLPEPQTAMLPSARRKKRR